MITPVVFHPSQGVMEQPKVTNQVKSSSKNGDAKASILVGTFSRGRRKKPPRLLLPLSQFFLRLVLGLQPIEALITL